MDIKKQIEDYISGLKVVFSELPVKNIIEFIKLLISAYKNKKQIFTMGNGGYGSIASHFINDIAKHTVVSDEKNKVMENIPRIKAICLCDSISSITAWSNDVGFEFCFSEQLKNWVKEGDIVIGISGSGNSENILNAFKIAREFGAISVGLLGKNGGQAKEIVNLSIIIPSNVDLFIEDIHASILHLSMNILRNYIQKENS